MKYRAIGRSDFFSSLYYCKKTGSTLDDGLRFLENDIEHGTILFSGYQTGGRGRIVGRKWLSARGDSLLATILFKPELLPFTVEKLPLAAGAAVVHFLTQYNVENIEICWPNDILVKGKKISGLLCEYKKGWVLCGIGINLNQTKFQGNYRREPISFYQILGKKLKQKEAAYQLLDSFYHVLKDCKWSEILQSHLSGVGEDVSFLPGDPTVSSAVKGVFLGLDSMGRVMIDRGDEGVECYISGEFLS